MVAIGLKKRDTFEEVVEYLKHPKDIIKYPDRYAKQIRGSFELSQLDGVGMMEHEQHETEVTKETEKANALRKVARNAGDTSHVELKAHRQQSRPPVATSSTLTQTETPMAQHHKMHTDTEDSGYETGTNAYSRGEVDKIRQDAELEERARRSDNIQKLDKVRQDHANELGQISITFNEKHHRAQEILRRETEEHIRQNNLVVQYHNQLADQRVLAEQNKLARQHQIMDRASARFRSREEDLTRREWEVFEKEQNPPSKRIAVVTRELANAPFNSEAPLTGGGTSSSVPMATPPPTKAQSLATLQSKAPPPTIGPIATAPPAKAPPPAKAKAPPVGLTKMKKEELINYIESKGRSLTADEKSNRRSVNLSVEQLRLIARGL
jgi:hypothetical protein